eukprot:4749623-Prymnesium_polylepis.1
MWKDGASSAVVACACGVRTGSRERDMLYYMRCEVAKAQRPTQRFLFFILNVIRQAPGSAHGTRGVRRQPASLIRCTLNEALGINSGRAKSRRPGARRGARVSGKQIILQPRDRDG